MWTDLTFPEHDRALFAVTMADIDANFGLLLLLLGTAGAVLATVMAAVSWRFSQAAYRPVVAAHARMQEFLADTAHEVRTPLAAVIGEADVALKNPRTGDEYRDTIERCRSHARDAENTLSGILDLSRLDAAVGLADMAPVDLAALVASQLAHADSTSAPTIVFEATGDALVMGDEDSLAAVARNLVDNAVQHAVGTQEIRASVRRDGADVTLTVSDDGPGIDPSDLPHIFERFHRGSKPSAGVSRRGAGLGLAIAAEAVHAHGGTIRVDDGPGATFTVTLPSAGGP